MTNEEIITKGGDNVPELLWENNQGIIRRVAWHWSHTGRASDLPVNEQKTLYEDLIQCGYLAVVDAYEHYEPSKGSFNTLLGFYLKKHFGTWCASLSGWTLHQYRSLEENHVTVDSLNRPVGADNPSEAIELGDLIADPDNPFEELETRLYLESLHNELEKLLNRINPSEARAIRLRYYEDKSINRIAEIMNRTPSRVGQLLVNGLRDLQREAKNSKIMEYVEFKTDYYAHVSVDKFQNTNTSAVELIVIRRENLLNDMMTRARNREAHCEYPKTNRL